MSAPVFFASQVDKKKIKIVGIKGYHINVNKELNLLIKTSNNKEECKWLSERCIEDDCVFKNLNLKNKFKSLSILKKIKTNRTRNKNK
jgi:hypothetical protein